MRKNKCFLNCPECGQRFDICINDECPNCGYDWIMDSRDEEKEEAINNFNSELLNENK